MGFTYTREFTDDEIVALQHLVPDIADWIDTAINEKIANCKKRMVREFVDKAIQDGTPIPPDAASIITAVLTDKNYQNQLQRDTATQAVDATPIINNDNDQPA